ncbi:MAG: type IV secretory system conjugative DNA transfer family protein [Lachnospiraceae bacterium]|nr:type IV secretory system conjugative DNA transfer family protein [Lachnospiraceae bacterium]
MTTLSESRIKREHRRKYKVMLIVSLMELAISPMAAYLVLQIIIQFREHLLRFESFDFSYQNALLILTRSGQARLLYVCIELLYLAFTLWILLEDNKKLSQVDTMQITEDISIPVPAGNGQHGNERFMKESEKSKYFQVFEFSGKETLSGKGGLIVQMQKKAGKELIYYVGKDFHSLIIGASGSGKTRRLLFETIWLQLMSGLSVIVSDVKGEIFYYTAPLAKKLGYGVAPIDLRNPKKSFHYNFLQPILDAFDEGDQAKAIDYTWDLVSVLVGQQKGEPLWYNGETATIAAAILIVSLDAPPEYRNLTNVYYFLAFMCESDSMGEMPLNGYLEQMDDTHPAKGVFAMAKIAADRTRSSFFTSALGTLRLFTNPNVAEMTSKSDLKLKDISSKKTIVYMIIPDEKKTLYPLVSILITQMYTAQVELANENGLRLPVDTDYDLDEVGNFPMIPVLGAILSAGRSRGVRANLIIQDYQQLESKYKEDFKNIKTNCQVKVYLKSDDPDTLKSVSENLGKYTVEVTSASSSVSDGKTKQGSYSNSSSLAARSLLEPAEVKRIRSPYAICMVTGEYPSVNVLPDLSEYRLNGIYGLGDEKHNAQLMVEREAERGEHFIPELQLWGVWKKYCEEQSEMQSTRISFLTE